MASERLVHCLQVLHRLSQSLHCSRSSLHLQAGSERVEDITMLHDEDARNQREAALFAAYTLRQGTGRGNRLQVESGWDGVGPDAMLCDGIGRHNLDTFLVSTSLSQTYSNMPA